MFEMTDSYVLGCGDGGGEAATIPAHLEYATDRVI
jgi:hypothetical protein